MKVHQLGKNADDDGDDEQMDYNYHFYKEYCRLYFANKALTNRLQQLLNEKQELQFKLNRLEVSLEMLTFIAKQTKT